MIAASGRLAGKVAIVTGGSTGIGEAIVHKFAKEGAKVLVVGLPEDPVEEVVHAVRQHGAEAEGFQEDISDESHAEACVLKAIERFDRLDALVNNAGVFVATAETQDYMTADFDRTLRNNCRSVFLMTKYALPHLQKTRGCVILAGSEAGLLGLPNYTPYGGTKGWIHAFMRGVAVEQAKYGVRANCVCPGGVDTAWTHQDMGPMNQKMEQMIVGATPMGRLGTPEEVANVYAFLASDEASYVTGALFFVDGGITVAKGPVGQDVPEDLRKPPEGELHDLHHQREGLKNKETHQKI